MQRTDVLRWILTTQPTGGAQTHGRTDGQTGGQTYCDPLCWHDRLR